MRNSQAALDAEKRLVSLHENNIFIKKMSKITKLLNTLFWWENSFTPSCIGIVISPPLLDFVQTHPNRSSETTIIADDLNRKMCLKTFPDKSLFFEILMKHYNNDTDELQITLEEKQKTKVSYNDYIEFLHQLLH